MLLAYGIYCHYTLHWCLSGFARKLTALLQSDTSLPTSQAQLLYTELNCSAALWGAAGTEFMAALWPAALVPTAIAATAAAVHGDAAASTAAVAPVVGGVSSTPTLNAKTIAGVPFNKR
jgi:hypothetical protein